jgi:hypothetical protein
MRYFLLYFLCALPCILMAQATQTTSGNWNVPGNWSGGNIGGTDPTESATLSGVNSTIVNMDDYTVSSLAIQNGASLTIDPGGKLTVTNDVINSVNQATLTVNGDMEICGNLDMLNNFTLEVNGTLRIKGDFISENGLDITVTGTLIIEGSFTAKNTSRWEVPGTVDIGGDLNVKNNTNIIEPVGDFTVGGSCSEGNTGTTFCDTVLPITLLSFDAKQEGQLVSIRWVTGIEIENDFYTVQKSLDGIEYMDLANVKGAGNSNESIEYTITDNFPIHGVSYYRLVQTDFDGTRAIFPPVRVDFNGINSSVIYPNPVNSGQSFKLYTGIGYGEEVEVVLRDIQGRTILSEVVGLSIHEITLNDNYEPGVYIVELRNSTQRSLHRLVIK